MLQVPSVQHDPEHAQLQGVQQTTLLWSVSMVFLYCVWITLITSEEAAAGPTHVPLYEPHGIKYIIGVLSKLTSLNMETFSLESMIYRCYAAYKH